MESKKTTIEFKHYANMQIDVATTTEYSALVITWDSVGGRKSVAVVLNDESRQKLIDGLSTERDD